MQSRHCIFITCRAARQRGRLFCPSHSCRKPGKAAEIKTQQEADKFNEAVSKYKSCIEDFVLQQEDAAMIHRRGK